MAGSWPVICISVPIPITIVGDRPSSYQPAGDNAPSIPPTIVGTKENNVASTGARVETVRQQSRQTVTDESAIIEHETNASIVETSTASAMPNSVQLFSYRDS
jgi:hypothetical protein